MNKLNTYIYERIVKKFGKKLSGKEMKENLIMFKTNLKGFEHYKKITYIIFEDYNFPDLNWRCYTGNWSYLDIIKDYFSDVDYDPFEVPEDCGIIYDVREDKFIKVELHLSENIIEVK